MTRADSWRIASARACPQGLEANPIPTPAISRPGPDPGASLRRRLAPQECWIQPHRSGEASIPRVDRWRGWTETNPVLLVDEHTVLHSGWRWRIEDQGCRRWRGADGDRGIGDGRRIAARYHSARSRHVWIEWHEGDPNFIHPCAPTRRSWALETIVSAGDRFISSFNFCRRWRDQAAKRSAGTPRRACFFDPIADGGRVTALIG